jgi:glyoxylase I family protein
MIGPVDHVYYWTRDMARSIAFYTEVVGFELAHRGGDEWAEFQAGPIRFGLHATDGGLPGSGTVVLQVDDLDAARRALEAFGVNFDAHVGDIEGFARFATFRDPDDNPVQLIEYR